MNNFLQTLANAVLSISIGQEAKATPAAEAKPAEAPAPDDAGAAPEGSDAPKADAGTSGTEAPKQTETPKAEDTSNDYTKSWFGNSIKFERKGNGWKLTLRILPLLKAIAVVAVLVACKVVFSRLMRVDPDPMAS